MAYFVELDSGGTKTECWLGNEREVLARAVCPTVKLTRVSQEVAALRLRGVEREERRGEPDGGSDVVGAEWDGRALDGEGQSR